jgi:hypothetical protein
MPQYAFGSGSLFAVPNATNPTPVLLGTLQECSIDISFSIKELYGQNQFPVAIGRGPGKVDAKAKTAEFSALALNSIFTGLTSSAGGLTVATSESGTVPSTPYQVTVTNAATFVDDLGVVFSTTAVRLTRVASAPAAGQYSVVVATGVYTFNSTDTAKGVLISYSYTQASGQTNTIVTNQAMGSAPTFMAVLSNPYQGSNLVLKLYSCVSTKLSMGFKNEDFSVPEFGFQAFANAAGQVYQLTLSA